MSVLIFLSIVSRWHTVFIIAVSCQYILKTKINLASYHTEKEWLVSLSFIGLSVVCLILPSIKVGVCLLYDDDGKKNTLHRLNWATCFYMYNMYEKTCCEPVKLLYCDINSTLLKLPYAARLCSKNSPFTDVKCRVPIPIRVFVLLFLSWK